MALSREALRRWSRVHSWTSLAATVFLLVLCLTGLPLIFHAEIDALARPPQSQATSAAAPSPGNGGGAPSLDGIVTQAVAGHPQLRPLYLSWDEKLPVISAILAPSLDAADATLEILPFDAHSGARLDAAPVDAGVMAFLLKLHTSLFAGLPGTLFLGLVALVFVVALVSGVVVYAPFMRRLAFGALRRDRSPRIKWLDLHNFTGIVTTGWLGVVALTGFVLAMETPITLIWQADQLSTLAAPYRGQPPPARLVPVDTVLAAVREQAPDGAVSFIAWPGSRYATAHHFLVALRGTTPLTAKLVRIALVDAGTGRLTNLRETPWYVKAAFLSVPLHFGDYGELPLKIIWALLDLIAIAVLGTGLYLWLARRRQGAVAAEEA